MDGTGRCVICGRDEEPGISILGRFICGECEEPIVNADILCSRYDEYKDLIRDKILLDVKT